MPSFVRWLRSQGRIFLVLGLDVVTESLALGIVASGLVLAGNYVVEPVLSGVTVCEECWSTVSVIDY